MKVLHIILLFTILFGACDFIDKHVLLKEQEVKTIRKHPKNNYKDGWVRSYYENGNVKYETQYKDSLKHGKGFQYDITGAKKVEVNYIRGKKHGMAYNYYASGKVHSEISYKYSVKDGRAKWYYKNGQIYRVNPYENGVLHGEQIKYYENGNIKSRQTYRMGSPQNDLKEYGSTGQLKSIYPDFIVKEGNYVPMDGTYRISAKFSKQLKSASYKIIDPETGEASHMPINNGEALYNIYVPKNTFYMKKLIVRGEFETSFRNHYVVDKIINIAVEN